MTELDPVAVPARYDDEATRPYIRGARRTSELRLVIADDSAEMRWLVRAAVGAEFGTVVEVADGRELFWQLLHSSFTADDGRGSNLFVIADVAMPAYNGLDVLDAWRELERRTPTIVITAFPSDDVRARAERLGAAVLAKPFSTAALRQMIRDVARG
jgi:CheY-like chemotaxis protein